MEKKKGSVKKYNIKGITKWKFQNGKSKITKIEKLYLW